MWIKGVKSPPQPYGVLSAFWRYSLPHSIPPANCLSRHKSRFKSEISPKKSSSKQKEKQGKNPVSRLLYAIFKVVKYALREKEKTKTELSSILISLGGEGEIRTLEPCYGLHDFQSCALDQLGDFSICWISIAHLFSKIKGFFKFFHYFFNII